MPGLLSFVYHPGRCCLIDLDWEAYRVLQTWTESAGSDSQFVVRLAIPSEHHQFLKRADLGQQCRVIGLEYVKVFRKNA